MAELPHILSLHDRKVVFLGLPPCDTARIRYTSTGRVETVATLGIAAYLPETLQCLEIVLGSRFDNLDDMALVSVMRHAKDHCPSIKSMFFECHINAWMPERVGTVFSWRPHSLEHFECCAIDSKLTCEVRITYQKTSQQHWEDVSTRSFARIPANLVSHVFNLPQGLLQLENLHELEICQPTQHHLPPANIVDMESTLTLMSRLRCLRKITFPVDFPDSLANMLRVLSALPNFHVLVLLPPSSIALSDWINSNTITELAQGFQGFHHLWKVTLPLGLVCNDTLDVLATILDLRHLTFMSDETSRTQTTYRPAFGGQFPALRCLKVLGSFSAFANVILGCVYIQSSILTTVIVRTHSLQHAEEMRDVMHTLAMQCRGLTKLWIHIKHVHAKENRVWVDVMPLRGCSHLEEFTIKHPLPLPLSDADILQLLDSWPRARHISLNPRPRWRTAMGYYIPTLTCLGHVTRKGRQLLHFGVYLNTHTKVTVCEPLLAELRKVDLGKSDRNKATTALIGSLFPNAICI